MSNKCRSKKIREIISGGNIFLLLRVDSRLHKTCQKTNPTENDLKISSNIPATYLETQTISDHAVDTNGFLVCFFTGAFAHKLSKITGAQRKSKKCNQILLFCRGRCSGGLSVQGYLNGRGKPPTLFPRRELAEAFF